MTTLYDLIREAPATPLIRLAQELKAKADIEWDEAREWGQRCTPGGDTEAAYHRGKANALCEVLGDQAGLFLLIDHLPEGNVSL